MSKKLIYAGIGSRQTDGTTITEMVSIAEQLSPNWILRSGHAGGADLAFERGAMLGGGTKEIFIPWFGFNNAPRDHADYIRPRATQELADFTASFHPAWNRCSAEAKLLHMRNSCQILGLYGETPVDMVICWTPNGSRTGGTGQALRVAEHFNIPIFDLGLPGNETRMQLIEFVDFTEQSAVAA